MEKTPLAAVLCIATSLLISTVFAAPPPSSPGKEIIDNSVIVPGTKILPYTREGEWKVFRLVAEPVNQLIFNSKIDKLTPYVKKANRFVGTQEMKLHQKKQVLSGWGYNGQIPGPTIVVHKGDHVKIFVTNKLPQATTIHWHGLIVPNNQDGTGGTNQPAIRPGTTSEYHFKIKQTGTFMYHSGNNDTVQIRRGMGGFFIALSDKPAPKNSKDFAIMLQTFTIPEGETKPVVFSMDPNWFTFNGLVAPNFPVLNVKEGDHVTVRFGNLSETSHPIHLHGYTFQISGTEGGPIPKSARWPAATVNVAPGETRDISFVADNPGLWRFHCHKVLHIVNNNAYWSKLKKLKELPVGGMFTYLEVAPKK